MERISLKTYNIKSAEIDRDLSIYYQHVSSFSKSKDIILKEFASITDFIDILYVLKFVRKLSNSEITELTGNKYFFQKYQIAGLNWGYLTNDFDEMLGLQKEDADRMAVLRSEALKYDYKSDLSFKPFYDSVAPKISDKILASCHYASKFGYFTLEIYYLWVIKKVSAKELSIAYGTTLSFANWLIRELGLTRTKEESRFHASEHRDYETIQKKSRGTFAKSFLQYGVQGSLTENVFRAMLEATITDYISAERFEIVIGVNNRCIIPPYEVDIPLIAIDKVNSSISKIAIEFNGEPFHNGNENDLIKANLLTENGWHPLSVLYDDATRQDKSLLQNACNELCEHIKAIISI